VSKGNIKKKPADTAKKTVSDLIEDAVEILKSSNFYKIIIKGHKTNIIIEKPKETSNDK